MKEYLEFQNWVQDVQKLVKELYDSDFPVDKPEQENTLKGLYSKGLNPLEAVIEQFTGE